MRRFGGRYAGVSILAVAGIAVTGATLAHSGRTGTNTAAVAANGNAAHRAAAAARPETWTQRVDGGTALAAARLSGDRAWFDPIRRRLRENDGGHSPDAATEGSAQFAPHALAHPARAFKVAPAGALPAGAAVGTEVRGRAGHGFWTEWTPASPGGTVKLAEPVNTVQVRAVLTPGLRGARPGVRGVSVTAKPTRVPMRAPAAHPAYGARIFATREGLVGGRTANGYVIKSDDHFVALPSRRALSSRGTGDYTVRVCAHNRCDYAPVWDVGPWNIRDNHWFRPRDQWNQLKRGLPQAQAAYQKKFNGGRDGFGRQVRNPAGIDLGDGTARESLGVGDGGWVRVTYVWTGAYPRNAMVHAMKGWHKVTLYRAPTRSSAFVGYAVDGVQVGVTCQVRGTKARGRYGVGTLWDHIGPRIYVPHAYLSSSDEQTLRVCRSGE
jgi:hypothetical protein